MDLNYNIPCINLSLRDLCAIKVTRLVLQEDEFTLRKKNTRDFVEANAISKIKSLDIPNVTKDHCESFIKPIVDELCSWYCINNFSKPILTQQGTLNLVESVKIFLEDDSRESWHERFMFDVLFGSKQHLLSIGEQLSPDERTQVYNLLDEFRIRGRSLNEMLSLCNALMGFFVQDPNSDYADIYENGFREDVELPKKYVEESVLHCLIQHLRVRNLLPNKIPAYFVSHVMDHSPEAVCFFFSKINRNNNSAWSWSWSWTRGDLMFHLLLLLTKWPFQRFFSEASRILVHHITVIDYWNVLHCIIQRINRGYTDWNYREMFIEFFNLGAVHRKVDCCVVDERFDVAHEMFVCKDILLLVFYMNNISVEFKTALLVEFKFSKVCPILMHKNLFKRLELFIKCCGKNDICLLRVFKDRFRMQYPKFPQQNCTLRERPFYREEIKYFNAASVDSLSDFEWQSRLLQMENIVEKVISEL